MSYSVKLILEQINNDVLRIMHQILGLEFKTKRYKNQPNYQLGNFLILDKSIVNNPIYNFYFGMYVEEGILYIPINCNEVIDNKEFPFDIGDEKICEAAVDVADAVIKIYTNQIKDFSFPSKSEVVPKQVSPITIAPDDAFMKEIVQFQKVQSMDQYQFTLKDKSTFKALLSEHSASRVVIGDFLHYDGTAMSVINKELIQ